MKSIYTLSFLVFFIFSQSILALNVETQQKSAENIEEQQKININTASLEDLMKIPHIGEKRAKAIIYLREKKSFVRVSELLKVKGIGKKALQKIEKHVVL